MTLQIEHVRAGYGPVEVLHGVSLRVPDRSVVALLGANGAGKSTLLKVVAGLVRTGGGRIALARRDITSMSAADRARNGLCLVPEGRGVFPGLSVRENIAMYVGGRQLDDAIEQVAAAFPVLGRRLEQRAGTLSGGEQQMLAVSRALTTDPVVVMADELSMGLAPVIVDEILGVVEQLRQRGVSVLLVEQYVERALEIADYVYVLHKGAIAFVGEPAQCDDGRLLDRYLSGAA